MVDISLPKQFLPDHNWISDYFISPITKHQIRYTHIHNPKSNKTLLLLPGLSEFSEKYIETAKFFYDHGFTVYSIDWAYQGKSTRYLKNPHKRHSDGYHADLQDLYFFVDTIIQEKKYLYVLGHSMGAHIALRFLSEHHSYFKAAAFSAPMLGIYGIRKYERIAKWITWAFSRLGSAYIPGGKNWAEQSRLSNGYDKFSSCTIRDQLHNAWSLHDSKLQIGSPTMKWLYETILSINHLRKQSTLSQIETPCYIGTAGQDIIVDNTAIERAIQCIPNCTHRVFPSAKHEILMETNDIRDQFLNDTLVTFSH